MVFLPSDVEAELIRRGLKIYTDAWNGPPLSTGEANHLRETGYTFEKPGGSFQTANAGGRTEVDRESRDGR